MSDLHPDIALRDRRSHTDPTWSPGRLEIVLGPHRTVLLTLYYFTNSHYKNVKKKNRREFQKSTPILTRTH